MTKRKQRSKMTNEDIQDSLKLTVTRYSPHFQQMVEEMLAQTSQ
jgi:hypothetical protein